MHIDRARSLISEIESLLYSGSDWDAFWRYISNEFRAGDVDSPFLEALAKLHALAAFDDDLNNFISIITKIANIAILRSTL
jgi:hypothetical protein